ncbi:MAG: type II toxin-antitoxin system Phd/YefM family antitoxin [Sporichthyaceae bacterium]
METWPLSEVKAHLSEIADRVERTHERVHITRNGRRHVVLLAAEDLESLEATLELLADPAAMARLATAEQELAQGQGTSGAELASLMERRRRDSAGG